jgi:hypothetical protein
VKLKTTSGYYTIPHLVAFDRFSWTCFADAPGQLINSLVLDGMTFVMCPLPWLQTFCHSVRTDEKTKRTHVPYVELNYSELTERSAQCLRQVYVMFHSQHANAC